MFKGGVNCPLLCGRALKCSQMNEPLFTVEKHFSGHYGSDHCFIYSFIHPCSLIFTTAGERSAVPRQGPSPFAHGCVPPNSATLFAQRLDIPFVIPRWLQRHYRQCGAPKCSGSNGFACESNGSAPLRAPPQRQCGRPEPRGATGREQPAHATRYTFITHSPLATVPAVADRP